MRSKSVKKILFLCPTSAVWSSPCLAAIREEVKEIPDWQVVSSPYILHTDANLPDVLRSLEDWPCQGIVTAANNPEGLRMLAKRGLPTVNLASGSPDSFGVQRVVVDSYRAGKLAAEHLLGQGLRSLAFLGGFSHLWFTQQRLAGFRDQAKKGGAACASWLDAPTVVFDTPWPRELERINQWLRSLPLPVGVFCVHDYRAQVLLEACEAIGLRIPDDVAVVGMDDDAAICEHTRPTLSSVSRNPERIARETIHCLLEMIRGTHKPGPDILVSPDVLVVRESSDRLYSSDPLLQRALEFMRDHVSESFNIEAIADHAGVSKRTLELRFQKEYGISPHHFLSRLRIQQAQLLMHESSKVPLREIAERVGFFSMPSFYQAFERETGGKAGVYRKRCALSQSPPLLTPAANPKL